MNPDRIEPAVVAFNSFVLAMMLWIVVAQISMLVDRIRGRPIGEESLLRRVPWNAKTTLGFVLLWVFFQIVGTIVAGTEQSARAKMTQIAVTNALLIFAGPILLARGSRLSHSDLALLGPTPGASFLRGVATWPKVAPYIFGLYALAIRVWPAAKHPVEEMMRARQDAGTSTLAFLGAVILAPAAEELLFRGVLLGALASIRMPNSNPHPTTTEPAASEIESAETKESSPEPDPIVDTTDRGGSSVGFWCANITISVIFAMMHGPIWPSPIPLFLLSLALGVLYRRTGGIAAPIGLHMVFNGVSTLMLQLSLAAGQAPAP